MLDASVAMSWCFDDEITAIGRDLLAQASRSGVAVPTLWLTEITNVLMINERRGRLTPQRSNDFLEVIGQLNVTVDPAKAETMFGNVVNIARREKITSYDASYLELALRLHLPLASLDAKLCDAAARRGVTLLAR